jgi:GT2 family glycosyltransferase
LLPGQLTFRTIAIKSPVCIPTSVIKRYGLLDENLAPCFHDDTEYCLRLIKEGYKNGVYAINYQSNLEWGGTRKKPDPGLYKVVSKNLRYLKEKYHPLISAIIASRQPTEVITIEEFTSLQERKQASNQYKINRRNHRSFVLKGMSAGKKIKYYLSAMINNFQA